MPLPAAARKVTGRTLPNLTLQANRRDHSIESLGCRRDLAEAHFSQLSIMFVDNRGERLDEALAEVPLAACFPNIEHRKHRLFNLTDERQVEQSVPRFGQETREQDSLGEHDRFVSRGALPAYGFERKA